MKDRGQYGEGGQRRHHGSGPIFFVLGITAAIYALSPGARHWYKHGRLPDHHG